MVSVTPFKVHNPQKMLSKSKSRSNKNLAHLPSRFSSIFVNGNNWWSAASGYNGKDDEDSFYQTAWGRINTDKKKYKVIYSRIKRWKNDESEIAVILHSKANDVRRYAGEIEYMNVVI